MWPDHGFTLLQLKQVTSVQVVLYLDNKLLALAYSARTTLSFEKSNEQFINYLCCDCNDYSADVVVECRTSTHTQTRSHPSVLNFLTELDKRESQANVDQPVRCR